MEIKLIEQIDELRKFYIRKFSKVRNNDFDFWE